MVFLLRKRLGVRGVDALVYWTLMDLETAVSPGGRLNLARALSLGTRQDGRSHLINKSRALILGVLKW